MVGVQPLNKDGGTESFTSLFFRGMAIRILLALFAMILAYVGSRIGRRFDAEWAEFGGAVAGLGVGLSVAVLVLRRRR